MNQTQSGQWIHNTSGTYIMSQQVITYNDYKTRLIVKLLIGFILTSQDMA